MNLAFISILAAAAALAWWLSGYDSKVTGENKAADLKRRLVRCALTLPFVGIGIHQFLKGGAFAAFIGLLVMLPLVPFWMGCLSELFSGGFLNLVDRPDDREFNPKQINRDLDRLAELVRDGRNHEAMGLCRQLLESDQASTVAIEVTLFELYREMFADDRLARSTPLAEVLRLRGWQRYAEAVTKLEALRKREPRNVGAALLFMRIQAADLRQPEAARALLQTLDGQPWVPPGFIAYARRCIKEWSGAPREKTSENIESLLVRNRPAARPLAAAVADTASPDELLAAGQLTRAVELLEDRIKAQPQDFETWLKLAETYGAYCRDFPRANKIIEKIAANPAFDAEQIRLAKTKFREWKEPRLKAKGIGAQSSSSARR